ncbi:MAG: ABC transporter ATP-binding protein [Pseudomonadota bacterium]
MALLEVKDLKTYFYTPRGVAKAVDGVSYSVSKGEALGIVGESGSGKSVSSLSIMRLIQEPPGKIVGGEINFKGRNLLTLNDREMRDLRGSQIAMVFQDPMMSLNPVMTVGRQISEAIKLHMKMTKKQALKRSIEMLEMVGISSPADRMTCYPYELSGGMCQRVMIAMALSCEPEIIIADEPTTALDVTIQAQINELFKELMHRLNMTVIWISHDLGVVAGLCDRINVMYAGTLVETAPVEELFARPAHPYTRGLLKCIPRLDDDSQTMLTTIKGQPPNLRRLPPGCAFQPRCSEARPVCVENRPELKQITDDHCVACWLYME